MRSIWHAGGEVIQGIMIEVELKKKLYNLRMQEGGEVVGIPLAVRLEQDLRSLGMMERAYSQSVTQGIVVEVELKKQLYDLRI